jgi:hypothetical protein
MRGDVGDSIKFVTFLGRLPSGLSWVAAQSGARRRVGTVVVKGGGWWISLVLPRILAIICGSVKAEHAGEMDEWFKSHAWKACIGS